MCQCGNFSAEVRASKLETLYGNWIGSIPNGHAVNGAKHAGRTLTPQGTGVNSVACAASLP